MARPTVSDTGPLNYLILIGLVDLLPTLFTSIRLPRIVWLELCAPATPQPVRDWSAMPPDWCVVEEHGSPADLLQRPGLHAGEAAAIQLSLAIDAGLLLMDDKTGVTAARALGLRVIGTLGILDRAARGQLVDLPAALSRLAQTNFHRSRRLFDSLLMQHGLSPLP